MGLTESARPPKESAGLVAAHNHKEHHMSIRTHLPRAAAFLAGTAATLALAPAASAATGTATTTAAATLTGDGVTVTVPATTALGSPKITGRTLPVSAPVGGWSINDKTGTGLGYGLTVQAGAVSGPSTVAAPIMLNQSADTATSPDGLAAADGPSVPLVSDADLSTAVQIVTAAADKGMGQWDIPANQTLTMTLPPNAKVGNYSATLTYTLTSPIA
jgi:hypothetical protein